MPNITVDAFADAVSVSVNDATKTIWPDATIIQWTYEAIQDFSIHVPPTFAYSTAPSSGEYRTSLPTGCRKIISVEYPTGEFPPVHLTRLDATDPRFWGSPYYYDFMDHVQTDSLTLPELIHSKAGDGSTEFLVYYQGAYAPSYSSSEHVPVPQQYHHILDAYVYWRAMKERIAKETQSPDATTLLLSQLATNADRAERAYRRALKDAQSNVEIGGIAGSWRMDRFDGGY